MKELWTTAFGKTVIVIVIVGDEFSKHGPASTEMASFQLYYEVPMTFHILV